MRYRQSRTASTLPAAEVHTSIDTHQRRPAQCQPHVQPPGFSSLAFNAYALSSNPLSSLARASHDTAGAITPLNTSHVSYTVSSSIQFVLERPRQKSTAPDSPVGSESLELRVRRMCHRSETKSQCEGEESRQARTCDRGSTCVRTSTVWLIVCWCCSESASFERDGRCISCAMRTPSVGA